MITEIFLNQAIIFIWIFMQYTIFILETLFKDCFWGGNGGKKNFLLN